MKFERGVMLMKGKKGWGKVYADGHSTEYGWMDIEDAPIHNPRYCKKPSDVTWPNDCNLEEINSGQLVAVERITCVTLI